MLTSPGFFLKKPTCFTRPENLCLDLSKPSLPTDNYLHCNVSKELPVSYGLNRGRMFLFSPAMYHIYGQ